MKDATQFYTQQLTRRFEANCQSAQSRIRSLRAIPDVVRAAHVSADPMIRAYSRSLPCYRSLQTAVCDKLNELIDKQLKQAQDEPDPDRRRDLLGGFRHREWECLRGAWAINWRHADSGAQRLRNW